MRNGLMGLVALMLVLPLLTAGCSSGGTSAGGGGASSGSAGANAGSAGTSGGSGGTSAGSGGTSAGSGGTSGGSGGTSGGSGGTSGGSGCTADAGTSKVTALDSTKNLKDLTPAEATQLCNETNTYFGCLIGSSDRCRWAGLRAAASTSPQSDAQMQSNCSHYEDGCHMNGAMAVRADCLSAIDSSCIGTVAQYSTCIMDETAAFNTTVKKFPVCAATKVSDISPIFEAEGAMPPASCGSLMDACAGLDPPAPLTL